MVGNFYRIVLLMIWVIASVEGTASSDTHPAQPHPQPVEKSYPQPKEEDYKKVMEGIFKKARQRGEEATKKLSAFFAAVGGAAVAIGVSQGAASLGLGGAIGLTAGAAAVAPPVVGGAVFLGVLATETVHYNRCQKRCTKKGVEDLKNIIHSFFKNFKELENALQSKLTENERLSLIKEMQKGLSEARKAVGMEESTKKEYKDNALQCLFKCRKYFDNLEYTEYAINEIFRSLIDVEETLSNQRNNPETHVSNSPHKKGVQNTLNNLENHKEDHSMHSVNHENKQQTCSTCAGGGRFCGDKATYACPTIDFMSQVFLVRSDRQDETEFDDEAQSLSSRSSSIENSDTEIIIDSGPSDGLSPRDRSSSRDSISSFKTANNADRDSVSSESSNLSYKTANEGEAEPLLKEFKAAKKELEQELEQMKADSQTLLGNILMETEARGTSIYGSIKKGVKYVAKKVSSPFKIAWRRMFPEDKEKDYHETWKQMRIVFKNIVCNDLKNIQAKMIATKAAFQSEYQGKYNNHRQQKGLLRRIFSKTFDQFNKSLEKRYIKFIQDRRKKMSCPTQ